MIYSPPALEQEAGSDEDKLEGADMTGEDVRQVVEAILPPQEIERVGVQCGVIARQRKWPLGLLGRALVIAAGTPGGASQADLLRSSLAGAVPRVARSACYRWFDEPLERFMAALAARALADARAPQVDLPGMLRGVKDWSIVDCTTVTVRDAWQDEGPGTGDVAALQGPTVLSVGCGAPVPDHFSPARAHDSRPVQSAASWQGCGLLADLAYASLARLRACHRQGGRVVLRLKDTWTPQVDALARGHVTQEVGPGTDLEVLLGGEILPRDGQAIDADGRVGGPKAPRHLRLVGVHTPQGSGCFRTHLPPGIGPRPVAARERIRWEVELRSKVETSVHRLDQSDAARPWSVKPLLPAARLASMSAALLTRTHNVRTRPPQDGAARTEAPRHPRRLALQLAVSCQSIAQACDLRGAAAKRRWQTIAAWLTSSGSDPHWRRRPSLLDQLRGWTRQPGGRKPISRRDNLKAVA